MIFSFMFEFFPSQNVTKSQSYLAVIRVAAKDWDIPSKMFLFHKQKCIYESSAILIIIEITRRLS